MDSKVPTAMRKRKVTMSKSDGMMVRGKKENAKLSKRKKKKPVTRASTPPKSSSAMKKSASSPAKVHLPSLKLTNGSVTHRSSPVPRIQPPVSYLFEKELPRKPDAITRNFQCTSCSPIRPASSASGVSSHTTTSSSKTDVTFEHCVGSMASLRWENSLSDDEEEQKRIELYKENRRKRYRALMEEQKRLLHGSRERRVFISNGPTNQ